MKKILIMRHGQAEAIAANDEQRKLTTEGCNEVEVMAKQLAASMRIDALVMSPYIRAQQTAAIVANAQTHLSVRETYRDFIPSGDPINAAELLKALIATHEQCSTWLVVAHMPIVSYLVDQFCPTSMPVFCTAEVCEIDYDEMTGKADLVAMYHPEIANC